MPAPHSDNRSDSQWPGRPAQSSTQQQPDHDARGGLGTIPAYVWALGFVVVVLILAVGTLWTVYALRGQWAEGGPTPTPIIWTPTAAAVPPTEIPATPQASTPMPSAPTDVEIGGYVQITGTEGSGLSLRDGPGTEYQRMDVGLEGEVFLVVDGPAAASDTTWWKLRDPDNEDRSWWAAANFLLPVAGP